MENGIQVFENSGLGSVHVVMHNGEPWFVAKDVCDCLELDLASGARGLDADEKGLHTMQTPGEWKGVHRMHTPGGMQDMLV